MIRPVPEEKTTLHDEVVLAGMYNRIIKKKGNDHAEEAFNIKSEMQVVRLDYDGEKLAESYYSNGEDTGLKLSGASTSGVNSANNIWARTAVETVAVNGKGNASLVFIGGCLYDLSNAAVPPTSTVYKVVDSSISNVDGFLADRTYFASVAAGNFDGNLFGFEQLVYTHLQRRCGTGPRQRSRQGRSER